MQRQLKKEVKIGSIKIGGTNPIAVQTMLNVPVKDIAGNVAQAERVAKAGCQIVRVTVPTPADAAVVAAIKEKVDIPVVADIHFDYRAALAALQRQKCAHPHRRQRRQPRKAHPGQVRRSRARGYGGERHVPCAAAAKIRL